MNTKPIAKKKRSTLVLAWLAPIIAIIISYGMLENYFEKKGNIITIYTQDIKGLNVAKSHIQFQGLKIGKLLTMSIDKQDIKRFKITVQIYKEFNYFIREGSQFWIVSPSINLNKIENIGTVLTGNYIEVSPPTKDIKELEQLPFKKVFIAQTTKPKEKGKLITLLCQNGDIQKSTKVTYKGITVGEILDKELLENKNISYKILIFKKYTHLVNNKTLFYKINPIDFEISPSKLSLKIASINNILNSSISFINDSTIKNKDPQYLYKSIDILHQKEIDGIKITFLSDLISKDEKILYKNIEIGFIKKVFLDNDGRKAIGFIYKKYQNFINDSTKFYKLQDLNVDISMDGINMSIGSFKQLYKGGISFITKNKKAEFTNRKFSIYKNIKSIKKENANNTYFYITIVLEDAYNLKDTSSIFYKNIKIGEVENISLKDKIIAKIKINKKYKKLFNQSSKIYMEGMKVSLDGIKNLSSSVLGDKLHIVTNKTNSKFKNNYKIDSINPINTKYKEGLRIIVTDTNSKDISLNAPLYYKYFQIGSIEDIQLNTKTNNIDITLFIYPKYKKYIKNNSEFKLTDVIDIEFGLLKSKIKIGNLESLIKGGISVSSPKEFNNYASNKDRYKLIVNEED